MSASYRHFTQVDVFTTRKFAGNPLAVFDSGKGLTTAQMQAIAREMNLSETTFLFPASEDADARVRIFTVSEELPFAGHPTLGTAFVLASRRRWPREIRLQMKVGVIPVRIERRGAGVYLEMRQKDPRFASPLAGRLSASLGTSDSEFDSRYPLQVVSTGVPFLIVPLRRREGLARLAPAWKLLTPLLRRVGAHFPYYLVTGAREIEARMMGPDFEDPATGSAAGCAAAYLVRHGHQRPDVKFVIHQGRLLSRPSEIFAAASLDGGRVTNVRVGGFVVEVLEGRLRL